MCGLTGFWGEPAGEEAQQLAREMALRIQHRGPDDSGEWLDKSTGLALAHRRLSIVDLSQAGHQPMLSACERYVISYNGEIYNHLDIRSELEASSQSPRWRGHSDTETLLAAIASWGVTATLEKLNGMFAFALWDRDRRELTLARDRMGEKPLYYGVVNGTLFFSSELKALQAHPRFRPAIDRNALTLFFRHGYITAPYSIYQGINKLRPAHYAVIRKTHDFDITEEPYWNLGDIARSASQKNEVIGEGDYRVELERLLKDSISKRLMADVPLGAFLSGGYDSSLVVALTQEQVTHPVKTFSIGFEEAAYDEAPHARAVAQHLGTDHVEFYATPQDALDVVPKLAHLWCEPFADSSQIPTYLVSHLARQHVKVSLSGDGGDELFYGYGRYFLAERVWKKISLLPQWGRRAIAGIMKNTPGPLVDAAGRLLPGQRINHLSDRLPKLAHIAAQPDQRLLYRELISHWKEPSSLVINAKEPVTLFSASEGLGLPDFSQLMTLTDMMTYLPDDILVKVDRASMAVSLESRVPLLDHRLVEYSWLAPMALKRSSEGGKRILKDIVHDYVPESIMNRPKMGFGVPIDEWLRGPLREWAESLLNEQRLREEGYLDPKPIRKLWEEHLEGTRRWHYYLWDVLMFEAWLEDAGC